MSKSLRFAIFCDWYTSIYQKKNFLREIVSFINLNWLVFSDLKRLTKEEFKNGAILPLSFINSENFSFKSEIALLFSVEDIMTVFVISQEVSLIASIGASHILFISA